MTTRSACLHRFESPRAVQMSPELRLNNAVLQGMAIGCERAEECLGKLVSGAQDHCFYATDKDGNVTSWGAAAGRILGYRQEEILGRHYSSFYTEEDVRRGRPQQNLEVARREGCFEGAALIVRKNGERFWAREILIPLMNVKGDLRGYGKITIDISGSKQVEEALHESEERFRNAFERAGIGMALIAWNSEFLRVNNAFCKLTGYSQEEIPRLLIRAILHPEDCASLMNAFEQLHSGQIPLYEAEHRLVDKHGHVMWVIVTAACVRPTGGESLYLLVQLQDITARKQAEKDQMRLQEDISKSAHEWQLTFDAVDSPIVLVDSSAKIVRLNEAARKHAGKSYRELVGQPVSSANSEALWRAIAEMAQRLAGVGGRDATQVFDGSRHLIWHLEGISIGRETLGRRTVIMARDITKMLKNRETLLRAQKLSTLGSLVGGVAHEVRNPLFILTATMDAWEVVGGGDKKFMVPLREQVNRLNDLMQELLEYGKPAEDIISVGPLDQVIAEAVKVCMPLARQREVVLRNLAGRTSARVTMDAGRLERAFRNLIENAVQFSPAGTEVRIETRMVLQGGEPWVECAVRDSGPGFRPEDLAKIFEPFFSRRKGGTGLGLALVQRVVEEHSGRVYAGNLPEGGAVVEMAFPAIENSRNSPPGGTVVQNKNSSRR